MEEINKKDIITGEIYYVKGSAWNYIVEATESLSSCNNICLNNKYLHIGTGGFYGSGFYLATEEQKEQLRQSIKAGKYIPIEDIKLEQTYPIY